MILRVAAAFLRRDLAVAASHPLSLLLRIGSLVVGVLSLAYMARFVGDGAGAPGAGTGGVLGFWLTGIAVAELFHALVAALGRRVREAQLEGTLEALLATPTPTWAIVTCAPLADVALAAGRTLVVLLLGGHLLGVPLLAHAHLASVLVLAPLALAAFASLGLVGGAITIALRRTDPVTGLATATVVLVGGVFFPVALLPEPLATLAYALPLAPALEGLRRALFAGAAPSELLRELVALALFVGLCAPAGVALFAAALRRARRDGTLGQY